MTDITKHVTSLKLSRELKEAGVLQNSYFYWHINKHGHPPVLNTEPDYQIITDVENYSAFLASELIYLINKANPALIIELTSINGKQWFTRPIGGLPHFKGDNPSDCIAKMLLYLIKEGLINVTSLGK